MLFEKIQILRTTGKTYTRLMNIVCLLLILLNTQPGHSSMQNSDIQLETQFGKSPGSNIVLVNIHQQTLHLYRNGELIKSYPVSSSKFGVGNREESFKTPLGVHRITKKIGDDAPIGTIFKARINTGRLAEIIKTDAPSKDDYVTSRILWLEGLEPDKNRGDGIDSYQRYIYIHGTAEEGRIGKPASQGCIRMLNADVIELYDLLETGTLVNIIE